MTMTKHMRSYAKARIRDAATNSLVGIVEEWERARGALLREDHAAASAHLASICGRFVVLGVLSPIVMWIGPGDA